MRARIWQVAKAVVLHKADAIDGGYTVVGFGSQCEIESEREKE